MHGFIHARLCLEVESKDNSFIGNSIEISPRILSMGVFKERREYNTKMFLLIFLEISYLYKVPMI